MQLCPFFHIQHNLFNLLIPYNGIMATVSYIWLVISLPLLSSIFESEQEAEKKTDDREQWRLFHKQEPLKIKKKKHVLNVC